MARWSPRRDLADTRKTGRTPRFRRLVEFVSVFRIAIDVRDLPSSRVRMDSAQSRQAPWACGGIEGDARRMQAIEDAIDIEAPGFRHTRSQVQGYI